MAAAGLAEGEGAALLHMETTRYHTINDIGALIWDLLEQPSTLPALVERVAAAVENAPPHLQEDVAAFVEALGARDLLIVQPEPADDSDPR